MPARCMCRWRCSLIAPLALVAVVSYTGNAAALAQQRQVEPAASDRPKVAIVQYESGRIVVIRELDGKLVVSEPRSGVESASRYLDRQSYRLQRVQHPSTGTVQDDQLPPYADSMFFHPSYYGYPINTDRPHPPTRAGVAVERVQQNAAELRQQVQVRRAEQGVTGLTNRAGQVYPSTAGDVEAQNRLGRVQMQSGGSGQLNFYSLGGGLGHFRQQEVAARRELALLTYDRLLDEGMAFFNSRQYAQAARSFMAAAQKDQGDPGSRLHAAQCLLATGLYDQAMMHVRRAFELSPLLMYRPLNHRDNYAYPEDYDQHIRALERYVRSRPGDSDAVLLLAYEQFFSDNPNRSLPAMRRVKTIAQTDAFARKMLKAAGPVLGDLN